MELGSLYVTLTLSSQLHLWNSPTRLAGEGGPLEPAWFEDRESCAVVKCLKRGKLLAVACSGLFLVRDLSLEALYCCRSRSLDHNSIVRRLVPLSGHPRGLNLVGFVASLGFFLSE